MAEKRVIEFPPVEDLKEKISVAKHVIQYTDDKGKARQISLTVVRSAAYGVFGGYTPPGNQIQSSGAPIVINTDGAVVLESDYGSVIGGTNVAVAQATGSSLEVAITNVTQNSERQTFTFLSGDSASAWLRSGGPVQTTTTPGERIDVTFDPPPSPGLPRIPRLGTW